MQGVAGEWEVVSVSEPSGPTNPEPAEASVISEGESSRKREAEQPPDEEDSRTFKLRRKKLGAGLGEIYDPGLIPIKIKKKEESEDALMLSNLQSQSAGTDADGASASEKPKWSSRGWNRPGESKERIQSAPTEEGGDGSAEPEAEQGENPGLQVKQEPAEPLTAPSEQNAMVPKTEDIPVKVDADRNEASPLAAGGLFRKRKLPAGGRGRRG